MKYSFEQLLNMWSLPRKYKPSKNKLTRDNLVAHIAGGMIVGMMMMSNNNKFNGGADTRLKDKILKHTVPFQSVLSKEQAEKVAKIAYETILESDGGKSFQVNPYTFIESIAFDFEKEMRAFYDGDVIDVVCRFTAKNDLPVEDSYEYAENAKKVFRKKVYDGIKEIL